MSEALIEPYLKTRYGITGEINLEILEKAQKELLYSEIKEKTLHEKLYRAMSNDLIDIEGPLIWLTKGKINAKDEAHLPYLQDRNLFGGMPGNCPHCKERIKSVDHLATQCNRMLGTDYMRRHNEVVRCIHLHLCNKYGIRRIKRLRRHSFQELPVNTTVSTSTKQSVNGPDILIHDKNNFN